MSGRLKDCPQYLEWTTSTTSDKIYGCKRTVIFLYSWLITSTSHKTRQLVMSLHLFIRNGLTHLAMMHAKSRPDKIGPRPANLLKPKGKIYIG